MTPVAHAATDLFDADLEAQGAQAHATRNWVFLHGTAEQFARHTVRMLAPEQEYLRRHPRRTWQGTESAPATAPDLGPGREDQGGDVDVNDHAS